MQVSRYAVDGVTIAGLGVGLFGTFYLSQGLFGRAGNIVLRRLVIVVVTGMIVALRYQFAPHLSLLSVTLALPGALHVRWVQGALLGAVTGLVVPLALERFSFPWYAWFLGFGAVWLTALGLAAVQRGQTPLQTILITGLLVAAFGCALLGGVLAMSRILPKLSDRQLQAIGFGLTLLGIGTQFAPPILDLLNIKVV